MRKALSLCSMLFVIVVIAPLKSFSQTPDTALEKGANEFSAWAGGSFDSPTLIGFAEDRKFFIAGLRYGRVLGVSRNVAYEYTLDVIPAAIIFQPEYLAGNQPSSVYNAGLSPIGFQFIFNRQQRVRPFAGFSGGFLYSRQAVPLDLPGATKFNFTFDFGGGVQFATQSKRAFSIGYKFHHLSNAHRSRINPGLDGNVIYVGFSIFK